MSREMHIALPDRFTDYELAQLRAVIAEELAAARAFAATPETYLTPEMVCEALHISRTSLYALERSGRLVPARDGRLIHYRRSDMDAYVLAGVEANERDVAAELAGAA